MQIPVSPFHVLNTWLFMLKDGLTLNPYDRSMFYSTVVDREAGYTDYPKWEEVQKANKIVENGRV